MDDPGDADVRYELKSVFLIRNSHCVGVGVELPAASSASSFTSPVGGDAIAKKIGLAFSSIMFLVWNCRR